MTASCCHSESASRFFSFFARSSRKRLEKKGFEASQKQLLAGLDQAGFRDATLLEIGCGVGHLHQTLLEKGAGSATGVDLAPKMLAEARAWAEERGLGDRVHYIEGDFVDLGDQTPVADLCILDKVVCCYPDAERLIERSLDSTGRALALTYPRDRWFVRLGTRIWNAALWLIRSDFRTFVHDPARVERWITGAGLEKRFEGRTAMWLSQVYVRT